MAVGVVVVRWLKGVLTDDRGKPIAGPGDRVRLTSIDADKHVRSGVAEYPRN